MPQTWKLVLIGGEVTVLAAFTGLGLHLVMAAAFFVAAALAIWRRAEFRAGGLPAAVAAGEQEPTHRRVGDHAGVVALLASLFFLYVGVETASGQWPYSELTTARGVSGAAAGLGVSLYWSALAGGRIALGVFGNRIGVRGLLDLSVGTAAVGAVGFWLAPPLVSTLVALPLIGLALAPIFPLFTVVTKELIGAGATTRAIGYQTAVGIAGGALVPAGIGLLLQSLGPLTLGPALSATAGGFAAAHLLSRRFLRPPRA